MQARASAGARASASPAGLRSLSKGGVLASPRPAAAIVRATPTRASVMTPSRSSSARSSRSPPRAATGTAPAVPAEEMGVTAPLGTDGLILPYGGGDLVDLMVPESERGAAAAKGNKVLELSDRNACDVELLVTGGFSPLKGFMSRAEYESVVGEARLPAGPDGSPGLPFGLPVVLDTRDEGVAPGDEVLLRHRGREIAVLTVTEAYRPDKAREALGAYGTASLEHPAVQMIAAERGPIYLAGPVRGLGRPDWGFYCATPADVRAALPPGADVLAFQCRNPIHRAHYELFTRALDAPGVRPGAVCLVHPTVGPTQQDDIPGDVRHRTYLALEAEVADPRLRWAYLPYSMHMAGPREALQHMIIRRNFGATHFIIGRDMAGCKSSVTGDDFYGAYDAQELARRFAPELGVKLVQSLNIVFTQERGFVTADIAKAEGLHTLSLSGTKFRKMLRAGDDIPEWFSFASVVRVLREAQK